MNWCLGVALNPKPWSLSRFEAALGSTCLAEVLSIRVWAGVRASGPKPQTLSYRWWYKSCITLGTLDYGNYGICLFLGTAGFLSSTLNPKLWELWYVPHPGYCRIYIIHPKPYRSLKGALKLFVPSALRFLWEVQKFHRPTVDDRDPRVPFDDTNKGTFKGSFKGSIGFRV